MDNPIRQGSFVFFCVVIVVTLIVAIVLGYKKGRIFPVKLNRLENVLFANIIVAGFSASWVYQDIIQVLKYYPSDMPFWMFLLSGMAGYFVMFSLVWWIQKSSVKIGKYVEWKKKENER